MKLVKRDGIFVTVIAAVLGMLYVGTGKEKAKNVPYDEKHRPFYEVTHKELDRTAAEKKCATCHGTGTMHLPKDHPPKEQCLLCHKLSRL